ncbi:MAG: hypothetical protein HRT38_03910 [Alteromonadaceae bacterium]|nr:hypothetical protein [Alteromonadaceae bacterium]NQY62864.1 hypothetical protein [Alteromonadaceae bacterium]
MLSTIMGFALSLSPVAVETPENNDTIPGQQIINSIVGHIGGIRIGTHSGKIRIGSHSGKIRIGSHSGKIRIGSHSGKIKI